MCAVGINPAPTNIVFDSRMKRVTIWKNILYLFREVGTNHLEGVRLLRWLRIRWDLVEQVCKFKPSK